MKHSLKVTTLLLLLFLLAQVIGIAILQQYIDAEKSAETGEVIFAQLPIGERPPLEEENSYLPIMLAILLGTGFAFLLMRFQLIWLWKVWFFIALLITLLVAFAAFLPVWLSFILAFGLTGWRILRPNFIIQTGTELFVYSGLAVIFVPLFTLSSMSILLVLVALYDAYAVWKSKHMIALAQSQAKAKIFAGFLVPYLQDDKERIPHSEPRTGKKEKTSSSVVRTAILGGGDVGFALLFTGVVLKEWGTWQSLIIPLFTTTALGLLFWKAEERKFYPAMPFITAGCFIGLGVVWLIGQLILV